MIVQKYTCPKCGYTKAPATHKGCGGIIIKVGNKWVCNACGEEPADYIICAKCGHKFKGNWVEVDIPL